MSSRWQARGGRVTAMAVTLSIGIVAGLGSDPGQTSGVAQTRQSRVEPDEKIKARLQDVARGILAAWDKFDLDCLGEDHDSKNYSDLRIALVEHAEFARKVQVIIVEFGSTTQQAVLDRFTLEGDDLSREQLRVVWN